MHDPPFWNTSLVEKYSKFWLPNEPCVTPLARTTKSCYTHVVYDYPRCSDYKPVTKNEPESFTKTSTDNNKRKVASEPTKLDSVKPKRKRPCQSKKVIPDDHVLKTFRMRFFPTAFQERVLKTWMNGARHTYNWALSVLKKQYEKRNMRIMPSNRIQLKNTSLHVTRVGCRRGCAGCVPYPIQSESKRRTNYRWHTHKHSNMQKRERDSMISNFGAREKELTPLRSRPQISAKRTNGNFTPEPSREQKLR